MSNLVFSLRGCFRITVTSLIFKCVHHCDAIWLWHYQTFFKTWYETPFAITVTLSKLCQTWCKLWQPWAITVTNVSDMIWDCDVIFLSLWRHQSCVKPNETIMSQRYNCDIIKFASNLVWDWGSNAITVTRSKVCQT